MIRVTTTSLGTGATRVAVDGRLTGDAAPELTAACEPVLAARRAVVLDLAGVAFVDPTGAAALRQLADRGAVLGGCSAFVREMLHGAAQADGDAAAAGDLALVARLQAGDGDAYEVLVRRYGGRLLSVARRFVRDEDEARDVVQDAFLSAFNGIHRFAGGARLSTWLHRIVMNAALMRLRTRRRRPEELADDLLPRFTEDGEWAGGTAGWVGPAEELLSRQQTRTLVRACIDQLPEAYRTVLMLRDIDDLDTDEAAELLGISANALKIRLHRARQALRTLIEREVASREPAAGGGASSGGSCLGGRRGAPAPKVRGAATRRGTRAAEAESATGYAA